MTTQPDPVTPTYEGAVIVFEGAINPPIFSPAWLVNHDLVSQSEAEAATTYFMGRDLSRFDVSHFRIEARRDRVTVGSAKALETYHIVSDMMEGIFEILRHTPIDAISMVRAAHLALPEGGWERITACLAPPEHWGALVTKPRPHTLNVWADRTVPGRGRVEVTIEPSQHVHQGAYVVANERIDFDDPARTGRGATYALEALRERWDPWLEQARTIISNVGRLSLRTGDELP